MGQQPEPGLIRRGLHMQGLRRGLLTAKEKDIHVVKAHKKLALERSDRYYPKVFGVNTMRGT